jgi:hypothetical protein
LSPLPPTRSQPPIPTEPFMTQNTKIFGTDGVRGTANIHPVTAETALKLGRAAAHFFKNLEPKARGRGRHQIVIGKDTRLSGYMLENAISSGVLSMGVDVLFIGPLPTPHAASAPTRASSSPPRTIRMQTTASSSSGRMDTNWMTTLSARLSIWFSAGRSTTSVPRPTPSAKPSASTTLSAVTSSSQNPPFRAA